MFAMPGPATAQTFSFATLPFWKGLLMNSKITLVAAIGLAAIVAVSSGNSALAAKKDHKSDTTVQKTEESTTSPYAPGQQRFRSARHKKKNAH